MIDYHPEREAYPLGTVVVRYYDRLIGVVIGYDHKNTAPNLKCKPLHGKIFYVWASPAMIDICEDEEILDKFAKIIVMNRISRR